ncbi:hypothetical protein [Streptomyces sp. GESEQ-35]|uniref:hypothetical protein n=1 Tax=Streptomyces sp. GESEQ-35 TaxID=2812657 RepID=UPI001FF37AF9|nr:hypothetical protein [Streptomyces sp. GESEQ-35]
MRLTVVLLLAAWFIDHADRLIVNVVLPSTGEEFDLGRSEQGVVISVFFLARVLCRIPGGRLAGVVAPTVTDVPADALSFQAAFAFLVLGAVIDSVVACLTPGAPRLCRPALRGTSPRRAKNLLP